MVSRVTQRDNVSYFTKSFAFQIATKTSVKLVGGLDEALTREAADKNFTGKCHPGIVHNPVSVLPPPLQKAIFNLMIGNLN